LDVDILTVGNLDINIFMVGNLDVNIITVGNLGDCILTVGVMDVDIKNSTSFSVSGLSWHSGRHSKAAAGTSTS
jgi:hypothetical protein